VPIRGHVDPARTFSEALRAVQESTVDAFSQALPFVELAALLEDRAAPGYNPIFEIRFALQNHPMPDVTLPNISARMRMRSTGTPRFALGCEITEQRDGLEVVWLHRHARFSRKDVEELDRLFKLVLTNACRSPERRTADLLA
jgi:non-ribosomal peptide synthetase component F